MTTTATIIITHWETKFQKNFGTSGFRPDAMYIHCTKQEYDLHFFLVAQVFEMMNFQKNVSLMSMPQHVYPVRPLATLCMVFSHLGDIFPLPAD